MPKPLDRPLGSLRAVVPRFVDVFICSASFEERSLSIPLRLDPSQAGRVLVLHNGERPNKHAAQVLRHFGARAAAVGVRLDEPVTTADRMLAALNSGARSGAEAVMVDITTFTHEQLLILLALLQRSANIGKLILLYTGAAKYMLGRPRWLTRGVREIRSVLGYPGDMVPSRDVHLVVLVGFELQRALRVVEEYQPASVSLGYSLPGSSISDEFAEINRKFHAELSNRLHGVSEFTFSSRDALETRDALLRQVAKFPGFSTVIAPMNTKVSTVGAALAASRNQRIQLCYAQAECYNVKNYSRPGNSFYVVDSGEICLHLRKR